MSDDGGVKLQLIQTALDYRKVCRPPSMRDVAVVVVPRTLFVKGYVGIAAREILEGTLVICGLRDPRTRTAVEECDSG